MNDPAVANRADQSTVTGHLFARKFHDILNHAAVFVINFKQLFQNTVAVNIDIYVIRPHYDKVTVADDLPGHQNGMAIAFGFLLLGKRKLHAVRNNVLNDFQKIKLVFFF